MHRPTIQPTVWQPPKLDRRSLPTRQTLPTLTVLPVNGVGAEDVLVDDRGQLFTGVADGRIVRLTPDGRRLDVIADTGGRPLGLELYPDGRLLVCDAYRGLLLVDRASGEIEVLVAAGPNLRICNNAAVTTDGTVYFTDSCSRFGFQHWMADVLEHSATGRLLRRDPDGTVDTVLSGLAFANGVALTAEGSAVVVAQTGAYQLDKVWLTGAKAGSRETLVENLPGFPDNLSTGSDGLVWVAIAAPRDRVLDTVTGAHPAVRKLVWAAPDRLRPKQRRVAWVRALDPALGLIRHEFYGTPPNFHMVTGVRERHGKVYLGSLIMRAVATFDIP
jgi:sugar lactone lactonase YvrE